MKNIIKRVRIWWLNVQINEAVRRMDYHFKRQELEMARVIQDRFHSLIRKRNALLESVK